MQYLCIELSAPVPVNREGIDARDAHRDQQEISRRAVTELHARSPVTTYYKDPREFDPQDPRAREIYARQMAAAEEALRRERPPPPAHSHHGGRPPADALHQLANVAAEQREQQLHRPHSEPRDKSPGIFHPADRSQMTPPAPRPSSSPYNQQQSVPGQRPPVGPGQRQPIGQPPPLINIKSPKMPVKTEKMSPAGGSITAGTPVQPPSSGQPIRYEGGSISSGTPRYDHQSRHPPPAEASRGPQAPGGSITRGTPVSYDQQQQAAAERRTPVSSHDTGPSKMSQAAIIDAATREAVARGVMYHERGVPLHVYDRATIEQMYQMSGQRRLSPTGITLSSLNSFE